MENSSPIISNNVESAEENKQQQDELIIEIPLPDELVSEIIFRFIPLCHWSSSIEHVSCQFQRCVIIAYNRVKSVNFRKLFSLKQIVKVKTYGPYSDLNFPEEKSTPIRLNDILTKLSVVCPNLTEISGFEYITIATDVDTWNILKNFNNLKAISLARVDIPFRCLVDFLACSKNVTILKISNCYFLHDNVIGALDVSSLTCLELFCNQSKPYNPRQSFRLKNFSDKLKALKLGDLRSSFMDCYATYKAMKNCTNLESFTVHLRNRQEDCRMFFAALCHMHKLINLCLIGDDDSYPLSLEEYNFETQFFNWLDSVKHQLQSFEIYNIGTTESFQNALFSKCSHLQSLRINRICENSLRNLSCLSGTLKKLCLASNYCPDALPVIFSSLLQLTHLTDLSMFYVPSLHPNEWENLWRCENLQSLKLYDYCGQNINDAFLQKWSEKNCGMFEKLISLELSDCRDITDVGACFLAKKAKNLHNLSLSCSRIGDLTIVALADVAKKLRKANFWQHEPSLIGADAVLQLLENAVFLYHLVVHKTLAIKVVENDAFLPFVEYVEIRSF